MISYEQLYTRCQGQTSDSDATSLANFKLWLNDGIKKAYAVLNAERFYTTTTDLTADGTTSYPLPFDCEKVHSIKVTISSRDYVVAEFPGSENQWVALIGGATTATESDYPQYYFVKKDTYEFYPASSTDSLVITMRYKINPKDLSADDYTTDDVKTLTNATTAVVGNASTAWTTAMIGRYFKIDDDGHWYRITARGSATTLTIAREYGGVSIAAGTESYTIGEFSLLPNSMQEMPINYSLYRYYLQKENTSLTVFYKGLWESELQKLKETGGNLTTSGVLAEEVVIKNYNDYPLGLS